MADPLPPDSEPRSLLEHISTRWACVNDPFQFVMRYAPAIRNYLGAMIRNQHDAEEITQDFLLRALQQGFRHASADRGRFRDYLKAAVRHAALRHLGRHRPHHDDSLLHQVPAAEGDQEADQAWMANWQNCVLDRAWRALDRHQRQNPGNLFHTVLRLTVDQPEADSQELADRAAALSGKPLRPEAFRKQLSRARRHFAELLVEEIRQTVEQPNPEKIEEELIELGLMPYVKDFLPVDWRDTFQ